MLPEWPLGTVTLLSTNGEEAPHAIPVSAALRAGPARVLIALASGRGSLARIRADPRVAITIICGGDVALSAHGHAQVLDEALVDGVAAVEIEVTSIQNHARASFVIESGVSWHWTDSRAQARDAEVRAALARLGAGGDTDRR